MGRGWGGEGINNYINSSSILSTSNTKLVTSYEVFSCWLVCCHDNCGGELLIGVSWRRSNPPLIVSTASGRNRGAYFTLETLLIFMLQRRSRWSQCILRSAPPKMELLPTPMVIVWSTLTHHTITVFLRSDAAATICFAVGYSVATIRGWCLFRLEAGG